MPMTDFRRSPASAAMRGQEDGGRKRQKRSSSSAATSRHTDDPTKKLTHPPAATRLRPPAEQEATANQGTQPSSTASKQPTQTAAVEPHTQATQQPWWILGRQPTQPPPQASFNLLIGVALVDGLVSAFWVVAGAALAGGCGFCGVAGADDDCCCCGVAEADDDCCGCCCCCLSLAVASLPSFAALSLAVCICNICAGGDGCPARWLGLLITLLLLAAPSVGRLLLRLSLGLCAVAVGVFHGSMGLFWLVPGPLCPRGSLLLLLLSGVRAVASVFLCGLLRLLPWLIMCWCMV